MEVVVVEARLDRHAREPRRPAGLGRVVQVHVEPLQDLHHRQANLFRLRERREDRLLALDADVRHRGHAALEARFERVHERHRRVLRPGDEVGLHELAVAPPERVRERRVRSRGAVLAQAARGEGVGVAELRRVLGVIRRERVARRGDEQKMRVPRAAHLGPVQEGASHVAERDRLPVGADVVVVPGVRAVPPGLAHRVVHPSLLAAEIVPAQRAVVARGGPDVKHSRGGGVREVQLRLHKARRDPPQDEQAEELIRNALERGGRGRGAADRPGMPGGQ